MIQQKEKINKFHPPKVSRENHKGFKLEPKKLKFVPEKVVDTK